MGFSANAIYPGLALIEAYIEPQREFGQLGFRIKRYTPRFCGPANNPIQRTAIEQMPAQLGGQGLRQRAFAGAAGPVYRYDGGLCNDRTQRSISAGSTGSTGLLGSAARRSSRRCSSQRRSA